MALKVEVRSSATLSEGDSWFGVCPKCRRAFPPLEISAPSYFRDGAVNCPDCHARIDLWDAAKSQVADDFPPEWALQFLGAHLTFVELEMQPGHVVTVDLTKYGVPVSAVLLHSAYQMNDARAIPRPIQLHTNELARDPARQTLYCIPIEGAAMDPGPAHGVVCWFQKTEDSQAAGRIVNAVRDLAMKDVDGCVVEAFSAFEIALFTFISRHLDRFCRSEAIKTVLEGKLSAYQMMELLPSLCEELGVARPPSIVWQKLHELRKCRNDLLHKGHSDAMGLSAAGDFLAAALIGVAFVSYVEKGAAFYDASAVKPPDRS
ncbi:MAG TPA: hypothetical protein VGL03_11395 [Thermoanaerobaculia bacterium]|jgi:hypothetical protein